MTIVMLRGVDFKKLFAVYGLTDGGIDGKIKEKGGDHP